MNKYIFQLWSDRFIMLPSTGAALCVTPSPSVRPSIPCLRFSRNRKVVETSNLVDVLLDLKFALLVTLVQSHVSTKLEFSMAFRLRENWRHVTDERTDGWTDRQTDGVQHLMRSLGRAA